MGAEEVIWGKNTVPCAFGAKHARRRNMSLARCRQFACW